MIVEVTDSPQRPVYLTVQSIIAANTVSTGHFVAGHLTVWFTLQGLSNMAKDPAFLFYSQDFSTGTQFFTDEQTGKYIRLLCAQHQHGHLSAEQVKYICRSVDDVVMKKFITDENGFFYNERLEIEVKKRKSFCDSRKENISKRYNPTSVDTYVATSVVHMENENKDKDIKKEKGGVGGKGRRFIKPSVEEVKSYFAQNGFSDQSAIKAFNFYDVADWVDSKGTKIRNWKQKMQGVWFKDENRAVGQSQSNSVLDAKKSAAKIDNRGY